jgi:hypothetical protein
LAFVNWMLDTGPLGAYLDAADSQHSNVGPTLDAFMGQLVTTADRFYVATQAVSRMAGTSANRGKVENDRREEPVASRSRQRLTATISGESYSPSRPTGANDVFALSADTDVVLVRIVTYSRSGPTR